MEEKKKTFTIWFKKHKTELITAGISTTVIIAVILGAKNKKALEDMWASCKKLVEKESKEICSVAVPQVSEVIHISDVVAINTTHAERIPYDVKEHIRNLPEGWKASPEKVAMAVKKGYELKMGQTLVDAHKRNFAA